MLRNRAHRAVQAQVAALRLQVQSSLDALASEEALLQLLNASDLPYPYDFTVGLRSLLFNGALLSDVELIEASFVERPQPGLIFVYSDRVELSGRMQMRLPAKASPEAISNATQSLRQTIERYLETLQPQEGIDLEALKEIVNAQGQTTFAATTLALVKVGGGVTGEERSPLPDRNKGKKISVGFGEKVFLAAAPAFKIEVEQ